MMVILIGLSIVFGVLGYIKCHRIDNPLTVFSGLWTVIFFLYGLNLLDYYEISMSTWIVLLCQTVGFSAGCFCAYVVYLTLKTRRVSHEECSMHELCRPLVYVMCVVTIVVLFSEVVSILDYLSKGLTYYDIAHQGLSNEGSATGIMVPIKIFIVFPTVYGISAIAATELFAGRKCKLLVMINVLIVCMYSLQHGGRHLVIVLVLSYIFAFINSNGQSKVTKKQRNWVIILCIVGVLFAIGLSVARGIEDLATSLYFYFSCCVPHLDQWISKVQSVGKYTFGFTSMNGFISPIIILMQAVGIISDTPEVYYLANDYINAVEELTVIGNGVSTNAFVGPSYAFFVDGGLLFVVLGNIIFGYICANQYKKMTSTGDMKSTAIYFLLIVSVCMSFIRFHFCQYFYAMALVMINMLYRRRKIKK